jgi:F-type H+-transporting ATPase subunit b
VLISEFTFVLTAVPEGRLFGLDLRTLIQMGANFVNIAVLAFILAKLLYKPVRKFMRTRADGIKSQLDFARDEMAKAKELKLQYEQKLSDVDRERTEILDEARKQATETGRQLIAEAKQEADAVRERAAISVQMERERAQAEIKLAIIEVSAAMTEKFVTLAINKETHDKLFNETLAELEEMAWRN